MRDFSNLVNTYVKLVTSSAESNEIVIPDAILLLFFRLVVTSM